MDIAAKCLIEEEAQEEVRDEGKDGPFIPAIRLPGQAPGTQKTFTFDHK